MASRSTFPPRRFVPLFPCVPSSVLSFGIFSWPFPSPGGSSCWMGARACPRLVSPLFVLCRAIVSCASTFALALPRVASCCLAWQVCGRLFFPARPPRTAHRSPIGRRHGRQRTRRTPSAYPLCHRTICAARTIKKPTASAANDDRASARMRGCSLMAQQIARGKRERKYAKGDVFGDAFLMPPR